MCAHSRGVLEVRGFSLLTCCWAGVNWAVTSWYKFQRSFLYQCLEHSGNVCYWEVACVLQTAGLKHPCTPPAKFLVKKGEIRAGILFSQSPSCNMFLMNLSHAVARCSVCPKHQSASAWAVPEMPMARGPAEAGQCCLVSGASGSGSARFCDQ